MSGREYAWSNRGRPQLTPRDLLKTRRLNPVGFSLVFAARGDR
jgi:hypothetical protein